MKINRKDRIPVEPIMIKKLMLFSFEREKRVAMFMGVVGEVDVVVDDVDNKNYVSFKNLLLKF